MNDARIVDTLEGAYYSTDLLLLHDSHKEMAQNHMSLLDDAAQDMDGSRKPYYRYMIV